MNYISEDYRAWKKDFRINSKTKSANHRVIQIYEYLLKHEYSDSDWWYFGGADDVLKMLKSFSEQDWKALADDLIYWTTAQLTDFVKCLGEGKMGYSDSYDCATIPNRGRIMLLIFAIVDDYGLKIEILEYSYFINKSGIQEIALLSPIIEWINNQKQKIVQGEATYNPHDDHIDQIKQAINKASR